MHQHPISNPGFRGLIVPMVTPMLESGEIDEAGVASLARHLTAGTGVTGISTTARIGEGPVLSADEELLVARIVRETLDDEVSVIATIQPGSTDDAVKQIARLADVGVDGVMVFPPLLLAWGQVPEDFKLSFWQDLAARTALPLVLFQVPVASYWFSPETAGRVAELPQVVSMKEASFDMQRYGATLEAIRKADGSMTMLNGNDRFVAEGAIMGAEGALIGIANLLPEQWAEVLRLGEAGQINEALELQRRLRVLQELIFREPILDAVGRIKAVLQDQGVIGSAHVRRPQLGVHGAERDAVIGGYRELLTTFAAPASGR